ncbi:MAG: anhydro-N-acetylmuramic acid kinase [Ignavibacteriales bacterium]|nr:anhydro-N-acetylmuramic acid kinase [Ignavibacteriales bacterium]
MEALKKLFSKKEKIVVGLMSGTSADGIDAALVEIKGSGLKSKIKLKAFETYSYPKGYKTFLLKNSDNSNAKLEDISRLDFLVAGFFADAAKRIVRKGGLKLSQIDIIGSHGQTIQHLPLPVKIFGEKIRSTTQIGNISAIAKLTGVTTIGDFRSGDVAVGGTGAPLVPIFDYYQFLSSKKKRALLNIGGIANITILPKNCTINQVKAFDTGPGNMIIDGLMKIFFDKPFDKNGNIAASGKIIPSLLSSLMMQPYIWLSPPKSTGRETFGEELIKTIHKAFKKELKEDIIATVTEFTALSIYLSYLEFIQPKIKLDEIIVSGGGVHNKYLMEALQRYFGKTKVKPIDGKIPADAKEAVCFAMLANELISGNPTNMPSVTGAKKRTLLGTIALP